MGQVLDALPILDEDVGGEADNKHDHVEGTSER
jgi:hypothetical protein